MYEFRRLSWPAYLLAIALIVLPLGDVFTSLYPWRISDARWRFGAVGLASNALMLPMAGLLLSLVTATLLEHAIVRRVAGILGFLASTLCIVALVLFALDALQTRAGVRQEMRTSFNVASVAAAVKTVFATATFMAIGLAAFLGRRSGKTGKVVTAPLIGVDVSPASGKSGKSGA